MQPKPDPIEVILARLMPPALSESGQASIETLLDELAPAKKRPHLKTFATAASIAAAITGLCAIFPLQDQPQLAPLAETFPTTALISESDRIQSVTDEGWQTNSSGTVMHEVRVQAIEETLLRDEASGLVVTISQPREETLLIPITSL